MLNLFLFMNILWQQFLFSPFGSQYNIVKCFSSKFTDLILFVKSVPFHEHVVAAIFFSPFGSQYNTVKCFSSNLLTSFCLLNLFYFMNILWQQFFSPLLVHILNNPIVKWLVIRTVPITSITWKKKIAHKFWFLTLR